MWVSASLEQRRVFGAQESSPGAPLPASHAPAWFGWNKVGAGEGKRHPTGLLPVVLKGS